MKLEQQVVSLELAKKLKKLGVEQISIFTWVLKKDPEHMKDFELIQYPVSKLVREAYSAFTVAELGEMLPSDIEAVVDFNGESTEYDSVGSAYNTRKIQDKWLCEDIFEEHTEEAETEADARAKILIYLLENKLISQS
jgi:hypothetical protein